MTATTKRTTGMILGKFMPPHLGHKYLVDFARGYVDELTVLVETVAGEPIPSTLRHGWMRQMFPDARVVRLEEPNPQHPDEHPDFWEIWRRTLRSVVPEGPDYVFASEDYGWKVAELLGATFVPVNISRELLPVSGTAVRADPYSNWRFIPPCVRPYFVKRVCIVGAESTGKSTLARRLAAQLETAYVAEYARGYLEATGRPCGERDIPFIARGQIASEEALAPNANRVLICDTDVLTTSIWSRVLFGGCPAWIEEEARSRKYDLYLLTGNDVPWVDDPIRYPPEGRDGFRELLASELTRRSLPYIEIHGGFEERFETALEAVHKLFD